MYKNVIKINELTTIMWLIDFLCNGSFYLFSSVSLNNMALGLQVNKNINKTSINKNGFLIEQFYEYPMCLEDSRWKNFLETNNNVSVV